MIPLPLNQVTDAVTPNTSSPTSGGEGDHAFAEMFALLDTASPAPLVGQDIMVERVVTDPDQLQTVDPAQNGDLMAAEEVADTIIELGAAEVTNSQKTKAPTGPTGDLPTEPSKIAPAKAEAELHPRGTDISPEEQRNGRRIVAAATTVAQTMVEGRFPAETNRIPPPVVVAFPARDEAAKDVPERGSSTDILPAPPNTSQPRTRPEAPTVLFTGIAKDAVKSALADALKEQFELGDQRRLERSIHGEPMPTRETPKRAMPAMGTPPIATQMMSMPAGSKSPKGRADNVDLDGLLPLSSGTERAQTTMQTATAAPTTAGAETARHVANQIAVAVTGQPGRVTEIALNPEELGRVRMSMSASETTITLHLLAERPETTDLLRRHIDTLAQEFRDLGYNDISFSFQGEQETSADENTGNDDHDGLSADMDKADVTRPQKHVTSDGLDLRL